MLTCGAFQVSLTVIDPQQATGKESSRPRSISYTQESGSCHDDNCPCRSWTEEDMEEWSSPTEAMKALEKEGQAERLIRDATALMEVLYG